MRCFSNIRRISSTLLSLIFVDDGKHGRFHARSEMIRRRTCTPVCQFKSNFRKFARYLFASCRRIENTDETRGTLVLDGVRTRRGA